MSSITNATREDNERFENEVRRIARELWPTARFSRSPHVLVGANAALVGSGGSSLMPPQFRKSIEIRALAVWNP